jgi:hypothetical protein
VLEKIRYNSLRIIGYLWIMHSIMIFALTISIKVTANEILTYVIFGYSLFILCLVNGILFIFTNKKKIYLERYRYLDRIIIKTLINNKFIMSNEKLRIIENAYSKNFFDKYLEIRNKLSSGVFEIDRNKSLTYKRNRV